MDEGPEETDNRCCTGDMRSWLVDSCFFSEDLLDYYFYSLEALLEDGL